MNEEKARTILGDLIDEEDGLYSLGTFILWQRDETTACLDGHFSLDELEAIAWWVRNKSFSPQGEQQP